MVYNKIMENVNLIIAKNLIKYRTMAGLTQLELAQKINYSDKSISKWERGEGLPDVLVLIELSKIYNITLNDFLIEERNVKPATKQAEKKSKLLVSILSVGLVVLVASICFVTLFMIPSTKNYAWYSYLFGLPVSAIVLLVFSEVWGNRYLNTLFSSVIVWGIILSICVTVNIDDIWIICIIGIVLTVLIIFWYLLRHVTIQKNAAIKLFKNIFKKGKEKSLHTKNNNEEKNNKQEKTLKYNVITEDESEKIQNEM